MANAEHPKITPKITYPNGYDIPADRSKHPKRLWIRRIAGGKRVSFYAVVKEGGKWNRKLMDAQDYKSACSELIEKQREALSGKYGWKTDGAANDWKATRDRYLRFIVTSENKHPREYERTVGNFEAYAPGIKSLSEIDEDWVTKYRDKRKVGAIAGVVNRKGLPGPVSARTVNKEVGVLKQLLSLAVDWKIIPANPIARLKPLKKSPRKERRALEPEEVKALKAAALPRFKLILRLFLATGLRRNELAKLEFTHIDWTNKQLIVVAENAKSGKARRIPLSAGMFNALRRLHVLAAGRSKHRPNANQKRIFLSNRGGPVGSNLLRQLQRSCELAKITDGYGRPGQGDKFNSIDLHSLRVTFCTKLALDNVHVSTASVLMGHRDSKMTLEIYTRVYDRMKKDAITNIENWG